jgi:hypothetical protein
MARIGRSRTPPLHGDAPSPADVDAASAASMDASDPPAFGGVTGIGSPGTGDVDGRVQRIQARAHELWQAAGSPDGSALDFWLAAEREIDQNNAAAG